MAATKRPAVPPSVRLKPLYKVSELPGEVLPYHKSFIYELIRAGRLQTLKEGSVTVVPASAIVDYIELLEREAEAA